MFGLEERVASSLSGLLTASVAPPALVVVAAVFNVQSVVYFVCWLNINVLLE